MSLMTLYFPDEIDEHGTFAEIGDIVDGAVPYDEYIDEMLAMSMSQIDGIVQPELALPVDLFGVFAVEVAEEIQIAPALEFSNDVMVVDDLFEGPIGPIERASDFVDPTVDPPFCPSSTCPITCSLGTLQQFPSGPLLLM